MSEFYKVNNYPSRQQVSQLFGPQAKQANLRLKVIKDFMVPCMRLRLGIHAHEWQEDQVWNVWVAPSGTPFLALIHILPWPPSFSLFGDILLIHYMWPSQLRATSQFCTYVCVGVVHVCMHVRRPSPGSW